jgi:hypothetical protein
MQIIIKNKQFCKPFIQLLKLLFINKIKRNFKDKLSLN